MVEISSAHSNGAFVNSRIAVSSFKAIQKPKSKNVSANQLL